MVKGNWERRIELANQRRIQAKLKKNAKQKNSLIPNIESLIFKLNCLITTKQIQNHDIKFFLRFEPEIMVCRDFLYNGCSKKR